ncbi:MAG: methyltransferase domain-containing protein [Candidatus Omnitrophica bacterium]|nr:methyltransferase domain-containing protein [Candidatus Omnitrophota bacterium]
MQEENRVEKRYDYLAEKYDVRWRGYVSSTLGFIQKWINAKGSERILDVACGTGVLEQMLVSGHLNQSITGIDISEKMLAVAKQKLGGYPNLTFLKGSASQIPLPDDHFDIVVCANSFHYFDKPLVCLNEMRRVLKTEGRIVILDWCRDYLICRVCDLFLKAFDLAHRRCYTQDELRCFLTGTKLLITGERRFKLNLIWGLMIAEAVKKQ